MPEVPGRRPLTPGEVREQQLALTAADGTERAANESRSYTDPQSEPVLLEPGSALREGRFVIRRALGRGGMGVVYEAYDHLLELPVALKTLFGAGPTPPSDLKREFRALEGLSHRNLVRLGELFEDRDVWFFTMELVLGEEITRYVRPGELDLERLRTSLAQLALGLSALHDAGVIHRDVKPSNTLVESSGRVVLLDFGLSVGGDLSDTEAIAGTLDYMAPEQIWGHVSAAGDLYALGVVLYEALTGLLPYPGSAIIRKSDRKALHEPLELRADVPPEIKSLCLDLLHSDPSRRPTAPQVIARLSAVPSGDSEPVRASVDGAPLGLRSFPPRAARAGRRTLIGRAKELGRMARTFDAACAEGPMVLLVEGAPGVGKSALLGEFCTSLPASVLVLSSRCHENEFVAHKALDGIVDGLAKGLSGLPAHTFEALPPGATSALAQVFPVLEPVLRPAPLGPETPRSAHVARRAAFRALRTLLSQMARLAPLVLVVDDLQWADVDSIRALQALVGERPEAPFLLLIAARSGTAVPLFESRVERLELRELTEESATELARALLTAHSSPPGPSSERLAKEAKGVPLFVEMLAHYSNVGEGAAATGLDGLLRARLQGLTDEVRSILELVSLAVKPVGPRELSAAAGLGIGHIVGEVRSLQVDHWVVVRQANDEITVEPYHDSMRHAVIERMSADERRRTHRDWAIALERAPHQSDPETLARHWESADDPERALEHAIEGPRRADRALAFDHAARLYGWALELAPANDPRRDELHLLYARSLSDAGRGPDAAQVYLALSARAAPGEKWTLELKAAEQLLRAGHMEEGLGTIGRLLEPLGMTLPRNPAAALARTLGERMLGAAGPLLSRFGARTEKPRALIEQRADACHAVAVGLAHVDPIAGAAFTARYVRYAQELGDEQRIALGLCLRAPQLAAAGPPAEESQDMLRRVRAAVAKPGGMPLVDAHLALAEAGVAFLLGDFHTTLRSGRAALERFDKLPGAAWETATAQRFVLTSLWQLGQLKELALRTQELVEDADERRDRYMAIQLRTTVLPIVHLKNDEPDRATRELERADRDLGDRGSSLLRWQYRQYASLVSLYRGEPYEAIELMRHQSRGILRVLLRSVGAMRVSTAFHRATAILAAIASGRGRITRGHVRTLHRDVADIERIGTLEHLRCLLRAQLALLDHDEALAADLLARAEELFRKSGMGLYASVSAWSRSSIGSRDPAHRIRAEQWMTEQEIQNPPRFARMLAPTFARD